MVIKRLLLAGTLTAALGLLTLPQAQAQPAGCNMTHDCGAPTAPATVSACRC